MYWAHNNASSPQIEAVLNKENVTLHDLMDEEDILQECKSQNKKLIDFLVRPDIMEELVTLTTVEPSLEVDEKTRYKYPNIACELLTSDVPALNLRLANDGVLLGKLYYFLESDPPLNPLLASYFSKTLSMLVSQKTVQVLEFLKSKENFVSLLVKHLGTSAIMDLMLKLITNVEGVEIKQNILNLTETVNTSTIGNMHENFFSLELKHVYLTNIKWLDSEHIVQSLIELLGPSIDSDRQSNAAQLLSDIIAKSRDSTVNANERSNSDPIVATLEASDTITLLLNSILGPEKTETSIVGGIQVLLALLNFNKSPVPNSSQYEQIEIAAEREHREKVIQNVNTAIIDRLKDFHELLLNPPKKAPIQTTIGLLDPPFGNTRLQITRLLSALLHCNQSIEIKNEISRLGTMTVLIDLFFKYTWNNFLHTQVQNCIQFALIPINDEQTTSAFSSFKISNPDDEPQVLTAADECNILMYDHIFVQCRFLERILGAWNENEQKQSQSKGVRQGYMGHLINIANNIVDQWDKTPFGEYVTDKLSPEDIDTWATFVDGALTDVNRKQSEVLGGIHPSNTLSSDNQDEFREVPFDPSGNLLQTTYTDFNRSEYIEVYQYNNDEEEMFERVCAETMNSFPFDNAVCNDDEDDIFGHQVSTTITSNLADKQTCGDWQQRRNSDADDPMANQLDGTIVDPWKTDSDNPTENSIVPIAETDPWANDGDGGGRGVSNNGGDGDAITVPSSTIDEGWANFDSFNNFNTATFNGIPSSDERTTSNFFGTFTQKFDFTDSDPMINSPLSSATTAGAQQQNVYDEQHKHIESSSSSADDNANISNNSNQNSSESSSSIDNFHTCLSNALKTATTSTDDNSSSSAPSVCNDLSKSGDGETQSAESSNETTTIPTDQQNEESSTIPVAAVLVAEAEQTTISDESV